MHKKLKRFISIILSIILFITPVNMIPSYAYNTSDVFEEDGMIYFAASLFCYYLQDRDAHELLGKTVEELVTSYGLGKGKLGNYASENFGNMRLNELYKRYLYNMRLAAIYNHAESGFFACVFESISGNSSIFAVSASGAMDFSGADQDTYASIEKNISEIIRASDDEMDAVLDAFSNDVSTIFGADWGANDFPLYFRNLCGDQPEVACRYYEEYIQGDGAGRAISATGHSLGAALAILISTKYGIPAVTFNSVPMLDVTYYRDAAGMSENFNGYDCWNYVDYVNECDLLAGCWEKQYKNYVLCDNRGVEVKSPVSLHDIWPDNKSNLSLLVELGYYDAFVENANKKLDLGYTILCAHDMMTMLAYDENKDEFSLSSRDQHRVSERKNFVKNMGDQVLESVKTNEGRNTEALIDTISTALTFFSEIPNRTLRNSFLVLGSSKGEKLTGKAFINACDVIYGGDGDDEIFARAGDDTICGGKGDDVVYGDAGNDIFIYNNSNGKDKIRESGGNNIIRIYGYGKDDKLTINYLTSGDINILINGEDIININLLQNYTAVGFTVEFYNDGNGPETTVIDTADYNIGSIVKNTRISWIYLVLGYFERLFNLIPYVLN